MTWIETRLTFSFKIVLNVLCWFSDSKWHSHRKMLTPAFHFTILEDFVEVFARKSEILVKKFRKEVGAESFDIYPYITTCALDIICGNIQYNYNPTYIIIT